MTKTNGKDVDYLAASAYVRALEAELLTAERYEQLLAAKSGDEAAKLLQSFGYGAVEPRRPETIDAALSEAREKTFEALGGVIPDAALLDVFRIPYDYHNLKTLLKAEAMGVSPDALLTELGRVPSAALRDGGELPDCLAAALAEGREVLHTTRDAQLMDVAVDKRCFRDLLETAERTGSAFLAGHVRLRIDEVNRSILTRARRMGKTDDFVRGALIEGGNAAPDALLSGDAPADGALAAYLARARLVAFGEEPVLAYLAARETEYANLRVVLMGRAAGVPADDLRARLRV
ncbi:MAG: V-type ATPase subunit [Oscillospiraceae bacterium]|nr:V-type ATPase subunit [Oscillospiraceae bacterium]